MVLSIARYGRKSPVGRFPGGWKVIYWASISPTLKSGVRLITVACKTPMTSVISGLLNPGGAVREKSDVVGGDSLHVPEAIFRLDVFES